MKLDVHQITVQRQNHTLLHPTDLHVRTGEVVGLVGPNGAGKSTLLRALANLQAIEAGQMHLDGKLSTEIPSNQWAQTIAYLPQLAECHWPLTVEHVVSLGREPHTSGSELSKIDLTAIHNAMTQADVLHLIGRTVTHLSGGEQARVMLARALATEAPLLLADEPTVGLDAQHQLSLMQLFRDLAMLGRGIVVVLHELHLAMRFCDRLVLLDQGRCVADGLPDYVLNPKHLETVYGIQAQSGVINGEPWLLPWSVTSDQSGN